MPSAGDHIDQFRIRPSVAVNPACELFYGRC